MGCCLFARHARHFLKNYIYPVTQSPPPPIATEASQNSNPQKPRKKSFSKNAVPAVRYDTRSWRTGRADERQWCACRADTCATREGRKNNTLRSFWHIGWKQPHMTNVSTETQRCRQMEPKQLHLGIFGAVTWLNPSRLTLDEPATPWKWLNRTHSNYPLFSSLFRLGLLIKLAVYLTLLIKLL
jgi:hypothetical protein